MCTWKKVGIICLIAVINGFLGCPNGNDVEDEVATGLGAAIEGLEAHFDVGDRATKAYAMVGGRRWLWLGGERRGNRAV